MSRGSSRDSWRPLLAGAIFAVTGLTTALLAGVNLSSELGNTVGRATWLDVLVAAFPVGVLSWWLFVSWPRRATAWRGAVAGVLTGVLAYPATVAFASVLHAVPAMPVSARLANLWLVTTLTLATSGYVVVPVVGTAGAILGWLAWRSEPALQVTPSTLGRWIQKIAAAAALVLTLALSGTYLWLASRPIDTEGLGYDAARTPPASTYQEALTAFAAIEADEALLPLHPLCPSKLLTHGSAVKAAVVLFHGMTSCPAQWSALGQQLFDLGYNVYMPRMKGHGELDPQTESLRYLNAEDLVTLADTSVALSAGLGDEISVVGISAGGTVAAWVAQYRGEAGQAVPVSPFFGAYFIPQRATNAAITLALMLPDVMLSWNPVAIEAPPDTYAFPVPSTHTLAEIMRFGAVVRADAPQYAPQVATISFLLNDADIAVNNELTLGLIDDWRAHGRDIGLEVLAFPEHLPHDVISQGQPTGNTALVYSTIIAMLGGGTQ